MKSIVTHFFCICLLAVANTFNAQPAWTKLASLPEGGTVIDLAVDQNNKIYALTSFAGEIYYTSNNGISWTMMPGTYKFSNPEDIEVDKSTNILYVGTLSQGLFWTGNLGNTWTSEAFYVNPTSGSSAYISKTIRKPGSNIILCNEPGIFTSTIYRSTNAGLSWSKITASFSGVSAFAYVSGNTKLLAGTENGVYVSGNDGQSWSSSNTGMANLSVTSILEKTSASKLYASANFNTASFDTSGSGVYISTDGGNSWSKSNTGMTDCRITCLTMDPFNGDLYATYYDGVYRSVDDGQTWSPVNIGLGGNDYTAVVANASGMFAASRKTGVAFSASPATGWTARNTNITVSTIGAMMVNTATDIHVLDKSNSGVYNYNGSGWSTINNGLPSAAAQKIARDNNGVLFASYVSNKHCLYRSTNQGASWSPVTSLPMPAPSSIYWAMCSGIKIDKYNNIYVMMEFSSQSTPIAPEVYRSTDNGLTWTNVYTLDVNNYFYLNDIDLTSDSAVYLTVTDFSIQTQHLYSAAWGNTFTPVSNPVPSMFSMNSDLVVAPNDSLFLIQNNVLYKRNGSLWDSVPSVWNYVFNIPSAKLYIDNVGGLYVVNMNDGIYHSSNTGSTWTNISVGLPVYTPPLSNLTTITLYDLQFDQMNTPYALCTDYFTGGLTGVYAYVTTNTVITGAEEASANKTMDLYPNPASDKCVFKVSASDRSLLSAEIFDSQGRMIRSYERGHFCEQTEPTLVVSDLAPGIYIVKVNDGEKTHVTKMIREQR